MSQFLRQKYVFIIICVALTLLSTSVFVVGEKYFNFSGEDIKAFVLSEEQEHSEHDEKFYRKLINNYSDEFLILETDVIVKFASEKWEKEMGFENNDILNKNYFTLVHPLDLPFIANSLIVVLDNGEINENIGPFRLNNKDAESKLYMATAIPIFNEEGKTIFIGLVLRDLSNPLGGPEDTEKDLSEVDREELENLISMAK